MQVIFFVFLQVIFENTTIDIITNLYFPFLVFMLVDPPFPSIKFLPLRTFLSVSYPISQLLPSPYFLLFSLWNIIKD